MNQPPSPSVEELLPLYKAARKICQREGYPMADPEYNGAVNLAIWRAWKTPPKEGGMCPTSLAILYSLHNCENVRRQHLLWRRQDQAGASRGRESSKMKEYLPILLEDFEFLSFVACHGRCKAAKLLGMGHARLISLLDEVALRVAHR